ncbi:DUF4168 domain-containing protein [Romeria aff. gracilis LEGE 07310]|uniref:DUF4168 domain-containing protein n=1 Tax=Vasconcelosia minhoensis LEGE 07310 TaxID=915328 RepID=A0A8J7DSD5_9CYAN|nr:DUF4168 domain-containing protein [Romeria gracilis]MBE9080074.1 DUF4168 domain-containing protein [Romeria aff. gracilis LEGE 07310]
MLKAKLLRGSLTAALLLLAPAIAAEWAMAQEPEPTPPTEAQQIDPAEPTPPQAMELSESQIDGFVSAYQAIQAIRAETQPQLIAAIEAEGLTIDQFNAIAQTQQTPEATTEIPSDQAEQFSAASEQVDDIRAGARADMEQAIQAEGLTVEEFEQIFAMAQQDPELQQQIIQRLEGQS